MSDETIEAWATLCHGPHGGLSRECIDRTVRPELVALVREIAAYAAPEASEVHPDCDGCRPLLQALDTFRAKLRETMGADRG